MHLKIISFVILLAIDGHCGQRPIQTNSTQMDLHTHSLARSVVYLANNYISAQINTLVIRQSCLNCSYPLYQRQRQLIDYVLQYSGTKLTVHITNSMRHTQEISDDYTLFVVNSVEAFRQQIWTLPDSKAERNFYFLIVVTTRYETRDLPLIVQNMILASFHMRVPNVIVIAQRSDPHDIVIYGHTFFDTKCQPGVQIYEYNHFNESGQLVKPDLKLFPMLKFTGDNCIIRVSAHHIPPYFMIKKRKEMMSEEGTLLEGDEVRGIDAELILLLAKSMHFRIQLIIPNDSSQLFGEGNITGCFAQLATGMADMAIGSLSGSDKRREHFSISTVYHQSYYVFVLRPQHIQSRSDHLILPFRRKVWIANLIMLLFVLSFIICLRRRLNLNHPLECLLVSCFGNPVATQRLPINWCDRYVFLNWLILTLVLRCAYQAKLFDVLRMNQFNLPTCLHEMIRDNFTLVSSSYHDFYPERITHLIKSTFTQRFKYLQTAPRDDRLATIALLNNLAYWNFKYRNISRLTYMREPIYLYQLVIYFPKNSIYKFAIDHKIKQLLSSGVMAHIERRYLAMNYADMRNNLDASNPVPKITNDIMIGVYKVIGVLFILSLLIFVLEKLSLKCQRLRQMIEWMQ